MGSFSFLIYVPPTHDHARRGFQVGKPSHRLQQMTFERLESIPCAYSLVEEQE